MKSGNSGVHTPTPSVTDTSKSKPNKSPSGGGHPMAGKRNASNSKINASISSAVKTIRKAKP